MLQLDNIEIIITETKMTILACSGLLAEHILSLKQKGKISNLCNIIVFENISEKANEIASEVGIKLHLFSDLVNSNIEIQDNPPSPDSIFTICYTSGTTGNRKGAMISHANIVATIAGCITTGFNFNSSDCHLSYLPLAHMMERTIFYIMTHFGASIGVYGGDPLKIRDDLSLLKPTVFVSVPRLFNRFYDLIIQQFNSLTGLNKLLINTAIDAKMHNYHNYKQVSSAV